MKILFLKNGHYPDPLINWLREKSGEKVIVKTGKITLADITNLNLDYLVSYNYKYVIEEKILVYFKGKAINLHISFLPWNKGMHPNVWSFLEDTPNGVSIHLIDKNIDTGDVLFQKRLKFIKKRETLLSSYNRLHHEIQILFKKKWELIKNGRYKSLAQKGVGNYHSKQDFRQIERILGAEGWNIPIPLLLKRYKSIITAIITHIH